MTERKNYFKEIIIGLFITVVGGITVNRCQKYIDAQEKMEQDDSSVVEPNSSNNEPPIISNPLEATINKPNSGTNAEPQASTTSNIPSQRVNPQEVVEVKPPTPSSKSFNSKIAKSGNLTFQIVGCKQDGQYVTCHCHVKSEDMDVDLSIMGQKLTRIIDGRTSKEYYPSSIKIGGKTGDGAYGGTKKTIVEGYPVDIFIDFEGVNDEIGKIAKLEMTINQAHTGTGSNKVEFRDIPVGTQKSNEVVEEKVKKELPKLIPVKMAKSGELTFNLKECTQTGQFINCLCTVESEEMDVDLSIMGQKLTRILDGASGKEFYPGSIKIGGKTGGGAYSGTKKTIVGGYPADIIIEFEKVNVPVSIASKLQMTINRAHTGTGSNNVEFRNIPVNNK